MSYSQINFDSIEKWASWLDSQPKETTMDDDALEVFAMASFNEEAMERNEKVKSYLESKEFATAPLFYKRVKGAHTYGITNAAAMFMGQIIENPGQSTIYANYFQYKLNKMGRRLLDMETIVLIFMRGFFSQETLREAWEKQKLSKECRENLDGGDLFDMESDNLLDYPKGQMSITIK